MTSGRNRLGVLVSGLAIAVFLITGCERSAAQDPLAGTSTASAQIAETPSPTPIGVAVTPQPTPTVIAAVTNTPAPTPVLPTSTPAPPTATATAPPGGTTTYTVTSGDWLFSIGRKFGVNPYSIAAANNIPPPYTIYPGQVLRIPTSGGGTTPPPTCSSGKTHTVQFGENLYRLSLKYGTTVQAIATANNISNPNVIFAGQVLCIP